MDLLGKKGEEAVEDIGAVEERIQSLEKHLDAVDSALQDFVDNYQHVLEGELDYQEEELRRLRELVRREDENDSSEEIDELSGRIRKLENRVSRMEENTNERLEKMIYIMRQIRGEIRSSKEHTSEIEEDLKSLENEFYVHKNNRAYDFEKKLDKREYQKENEELKDEISKLRASVSALADEVDPEDDIQIE